MDQTNTVVWCYANGDSFLEFAPYFSKRLERAYDVCVKQSCQLTDPQGVKIEINFKSMSLSVVGGGRDLQIEIRRYETLKWQRADMNDSPNFDWVDYDEKHSQILENAYRADRNARVVLEAPVRRRRSSGNSTSSSSSSGSSRHNDDSDLYELQKFEVSLADMVQQSMKTKNLQAVRRVIAPQWQRRTKDGKWAPFFPGNSGEIERSYNIATQGRTSIVEGGKLYTFNLASNPMIQEPGVVTGPKRVIQRKLVAQQQAKLKITNTSTSETRLVVIPRSETYSSLMNRLKQMYQTDSNPMTLGEFQEYVRLSYNDGDDTISLKDQYDLDTLMKLGKPEVSCQISFNLLQIPSQTSSSSHESLDPRSNTSNRTHTQHSQSTHQNTSSTSSANFTPVDLNEILTGSGSDPSFGESESPVQTPVLQPKKATPSQSSGSSQSAFPSNHSRNGNHSFFFNNSHRSNHTNSTNSTNSSQGSPSSGKVGRTQDQSHVKNENHYYPSYVGASSSQAIVLEQFSNVTKGDESRQIQNTPRVGNSGKMGLGKPMPSHGHQDSTRVRNMSHQHALAQRFDMSTRNGQQQPLPNPMRPTQSVSKSQMMMQNRGSSSSGNSGMSTSGNQGNFKLLEQLGKGSYGRVYKVRKQNTGQIAAVKQIPLPKDAKQVSSIEQEISLMENLKHDCIVQYSGTERNEKYIYIFMEYCSEGSLQQMLEKEGVFPEPLIKAYTKQILEGLAYLHSEKIVHRDLKCGNILVDHLGKLKLADFGCSKIIRELESQQMHSFKGTIHFMAPEVVDHAYYSEKSDIWALGVMIMQMLTGRPPFIHYADRMQLMNFIRNLKQPPTLPPNISEELKEFLRNCLAIHPDDRMSSQELLQSKFILNDIGENVSRSSSESFAQEQLSSVYETYEESTIQFSTTSSTKSASSA